MMSSSASITFSPIIVDLFRIDNFTGVVQPFLKLFVSVLNRIEASGFFDQVADELYSLKVASASVKILVEGLNSGGKSKGIYELELLGICHQQRVDTMSASSSNTFVKDIILILVDDQQPSTVFCRTPSASSEKTESDSVLPAPMLFITRSSSKVHYSYLTSNHFDIAVGAFSTQISKRVSERKSVVAFFLLFLAHYILANRQFLNHT